MPVIDQLGRRLATSLNPVQNLGLYKTHRKDRAAMDYLTRVTRLVAKEKRSRHLNAAPWSATAKVLNAH